jgi:hypothetical protein
MYGTIKKISAPILGPHKVGREKIFNTKTIKLTMADHVGAGLLSLIYK